MVVVVVVVGVREQGEGCCNITYVVMAALAFR